MTKDEILERYLNTVYFGNGAYGVQAAAEIYFGVGAEQLTRPQAALLAGLIRNPVALRPDPRSPRRPRAARSRARPAGRDRSLTADEADLLQAGRRCRPKINQVLPQPDDYFVEEVKQQLLDDRSGSAPRASERDDAVFRGGLRIYTTLDPRAQSRQAAARDGDDLASGLPVGTPIPTPRWSRCEKGSPYAGPPRRLRAPCLDRTVDRRGPGDGRRPRLRELKFNLATRRGRQTRLVVQDVRADGAARERLLAQRHRQRVGPAPSTSPVRPGAVRVENFGGSRGGTGTHRSTRPCGRRTVRSSGWARSSGSTRWSTWPSAGHHHRARPGDLLACRSAPSRSSRSRWRRRTPCRQRGVRNPPYFIDRIVDRDGKVLFQHQPDRRAGRRASRRPAWQPRSSPQNVRGGHRQPLLASGSTRGRQDRHRPGLERRLVRGLHAAALHRRLDGRAGRRTTACAIAGTGVTGGRYPAAIWGDFMTAWHEPGLATRPTVPGSHTLDAEGGASTCHAADRRTSTAARGRRLADDAPVPPTTTR